MAIPLSVLPIWSIYRGESIRNNAKRIKLSFLLLIKIYRAIFKYPLLHSIRFDVCAALFCDRCSILRVFDSIQYYQHRQSISRHEFCIPPISFLRSRSRVIGYRAHFSALYLRDPKKERGGEREKEIAGSIFSCRSTCRRERFRYFQIERGVSA